MVESGRASAASVNSRRATPIHWSMTFCWVALFALLGPVGCRQAPDPDAQLPVSLEALGQFGGAVSSVAVSGDRAWIASGHRVQAVDVSDPARPDLTGQTEMLPDSPRALATDGNTLAAAVGTSGVAVFDVSESDALEVRHWIPTSWAVNDVFLSHDLLYLAEGKEGLRILRLKGASPPQTVGVADTPGDSLAVTVEGDLAFVADWGTGARIIDVGDPSAPREIAWIDTPGEAAGVASLGELLLVADRDGGLRIIDVSTPHEPREVREIDVGGYAERVSTDGDLAYVAAHSAGLAVVDVTDVSADPVVGRLEGVAVAVDTDVEGDHVFVADAGAAVAPTSNVLQSSWGQVHMWGVETKPEVAQGLAGLHIASRSDAGEVTSVGRLPSPSMIESVVVNDAAALAYLADGNAGLLVMSLDDPAHPELVAAVDTAGVSHDCLIDGDRLLLADGPAGLAVFARSPSKRNVVKIYS